MIKNNTIKSIINKGILNFIIFFSASLILIVFITIWTNDVNPNFDTIGNIRLLYYKGIIRFVLSVAASIATINMLIFLQEKFFSSYKKREVYFLAFDLIIYSIFIMYIFLTYKQQFRDAHIHIIDIKECTESINNKKNIIDCGNGYIYVFNNK